VAFLLVFVPLIGMPALAVSLLQQLWGLVMLPARAVRWLTQRAEAHTG
jgi:hypothetical protein